MRGFVLFPLLLVVCVCMHRVSSVFGIKNKIYGICLLLPWDGCTLVWVVCVHAHHGFGMFELTRFLFFMGTVVC